MWLNAFTSLLTICTNYKLTRLQKSLTSPERAQRLYCSSWRAGHRPGEPWSWEHRPAALKSVWSPDEERHDPVCCSGGAAWPWPAPAAPLVTLSCALLSDTDRASSRSPPACCLLEGWSKRALRWAQAITTYRRDHQEALGMAVAATAKPAPWHLRSEVGEHGDLNWFWLRRQNEEKAQKLNWLLASQLSIFSLTCQINCPKVLRILLLFVNFFSRMLLVLGS